MFKKIICIECPNGCNLSISIENDKVVYVEGNKCERGVTYAHHEIECPMRSLTSSVMTRGLDLKMVPVKTDRPIPKEKLMEAMDEIKRICLDHPVAMGDVIQGNILGLGVDLIATRSVK